MANQLVFEVKAEDKATGTLNSVQSELRETTSAANSTGQGMTSVGGGAKKAGVSLAQMGKLAAGAGVALMGIKRAFDFVADSNVAFQKASVVQGDLRQSLINTGLEAEKVSFYYQKMTDESERFTQLTGESTTELQQIFVDLTTRLGDAELASEQLSRVMGLVNLTGKDARKVAESLGKAFGGQLSPLERLGILTRDQVTELQRMSDESERTAAFLEVLDQKIEGFAEGLPKASVQSERIASNWERIQVVVGELANYNPIVESFADATETVADQAEIVAEEWRKGASSIREELESMTRAAQAARDEIAKLPDQGQVSKERIQFLEAARKQDVEIAKGLAAQSENQFVAARWLEVEIEKINDRYNDQIDSIKISAGLVNETKFAEEDRLRVLKQEVVVANTTNEKAKILEGRKLNLLKLEAKFAKLINSETDEVRKRVLEEQRSAEMNKLVREGEEKLGDLRAKNSAAYQKTIDEEIRLQDEAHKLYQDGIAQFYKTQIELSAAASKAVIADNVRVVEASQQKLAEIMKNGAISEDRRYDLFDPAARTEIEMENDEIRANQEESMLGAAGVGLDGLDGVAAMAEASETLNDSLRTQITLWAGVTGGLGDVANHLSAVAGEQWDWSKAQDATLGGLNALSAIGGAVGSALTESTEAAAAVQAGFELAAAAGALGLALITQNPAFYAAAASHTLAAGLYGVVGAVGGGGSKSAGGASAGAAAGSAVNYEAERERSARALADAIAAGQGAQGYTINVNLGEGNVIPSRSDEFARTVTEATRRGLSREVGLNRGI